MSCNPLQAKDEWAGDENLTIHHLHLMPLLLQVPVHPFLLAAVRQQGARRERLGSVYVYFCPGPPGDRQLQARKARLAASRSADLAATLPPDLIIEVLLVLVRHPRTPPTEVARRLQGHSPPIRLSQVQAVFDRFDLAASGKKGGSTAG